MKIVVRVELIADWGDLNTIEVGCISQPNTRSRISRAVMGGQTLRMAIVNTSVAACMGILRERFWRNFRALAVAYTGPASARLDVSPCRILCTK
jgi:hypothetical protein